MTCVLLIAILFYGLLHHAAEAAVMSCADAGCGKIAISGEIAAGDAARFDKLLTPEVTGVRLASHGGSPREAMRIGRMIRARGLSAEAPAKVQGEGVLENVCRGADCVCASACFLIWAAGQGRSGDRLGIHRAGYDVIGMHQNAVADAYIKARMMPRMLALTAQMRDYLNEMNVPQELNRRLLSRTGGMHWLTPAETASLSH